MIAVSGLYSKLCRCRMANKVVVLRGNRMRKLLPLFLALDADGVEIQDHVSAVGGQPVRKAWTEA